MRRKFLWVLGLVFFFLPGVMSADYEHADMEYISSYQVRIEVLTNRSILVTEDIEVFANNVLINHGIYRDIPLYGHAPLGLLRKYPIKILEVWKDGEPEPWHTDNETMSLRVYAGSQDITLNPGMYRYRFQYQVEEALTVVSNTAELYWNAIGTEWDFPIEKAEVMIKLPFESQQEVLYQRAFHGLQGETNSNYDYQKNWNTLVYKLKEDLGRNKGLTVKIIWKNDRIPVPSSLERYFKLFKDNKGIATIFTGILLIFLYYIITWFLLGKDPAKGPIMTYFEPPDGLSPSAMRFIRKMGYDQKNFTAVIIQLAVKGHIKITETKDEYKLVRLNDTLEGLTEEEKIVSKELFYSGSSLEVDNTNHSVFSEAIQKFKASLKKQFETHYFVTNRKIFIPGLLMTIAFMILGFIFDSSNFIAGFMMLWLSIWNIGVFFLLKQVIHSWKSASSAPKKSFWKYLGAMYMTFFSSFFVIADVVVFFIFFRFITTSVWIVPLAVAAIFMNYLFYHLLKAPTLAGRKIMDKIEGFYNFINVAEKDRLEVFNPPVKEISVFEKLLPYALAFDIEENWAGYFHDIMGTSQGGAGSYHPSWYSGSSLSSMNFTQFTSSLGSNFSNALSSASVSPSSSGSGGGGGSSGGGGGGGGGGGW